ncbi:MAG: acetate CoA-transferase subunit alpha [Propionivibrio sp.]
MNKLMNTSQSKIYSYAQLRTRFKDGMSLLCGGFMGVGTPDGIVQEILDSGVRDLTLIGSDTARPDTGIGVLISNRRVRRVIASHIGTNPETGRQMIAGTLAVTLVPQGTFVERIRCGGAGLGGVLTPTGVGTMVEEGKTKLLVDGVEYLLETPLRADMAILKAYQADARGNLIYRRAARNFNPLMALAADFVVAQIDELVPVGALDPERIDTPSILVDALVTGARE